MKGFLDDARQLSRIHDQIRVLHDRQGHPVEVGFLEGRLADELGIDLTGDGDQWDGIHVGIGDGRHEIGGAGAAGGHADTDFTFHPGVALGGE